MRARLDGSLGLAILGLCMVALLVAAYRFGSLAATPKVEDTAPAAAQSQADGSVIPERRPPAGKVEAAPHKLPSGSVEERRVSVTVKPRAKARSSGPETSAVLDCPPVTVDLSLVRSGSGRRAVVSSPDGEVLKALDIPLEAVAMPSERHWAAGLSCNPGDCQRTAGVIVQRDLGRVRLGAELARDPAGGIGSRVHAMWSW